MTANINEYRNVIRNICKHFRFLCAFTYRAEYSQKFPVVRADMVSLLVDREM